MMKLYHVMIALLVLAGSIAAQDTTIQGDSILSLCKSCSQILDETARRKCYDKIFGVPAKPPTPKATFKGTGKWERMEVKIPLTDETETSLALRAKEFRFESNSYFSLTITCSDTMIVAGITWGKKIVNDANHFVSFRIDDQPIDSIECIRTQDMYSSIFVGSPKEFIGKLLSASTLRVTVDIYRAADPTLNFDVRGLSEAIKVLPMACQP